MCKKFTRGSGPRRSFFEEIEERLYYQSIPKSKNKVPTAKRRTRNKMLALIKATCPEEWDCLRANLARMSRNEIRATLKKFDKQCPDAMDFFNKKHSKIKSFRIKKFFEFHYPLALEFLKLMPRQFSDAEIQDLFDRMQKKHPLSLMLLLMEKTPVMLPMIDIY